MLSSFRKENDKKRRRDEEDPEIQEEIEEIETKPKKQKTENEEPEPIDEINDNKIIISASSRDFAKKNDFNPDFFKEYLVSDFSFIDRKRILQNVFKKYSKNTYVVIDDLRTLEDWKFHMGKEIDILSGRVAYFKSKNELSSEFNLSEEDRKYQKISEQINIINKIFIRHEKTHLSLADTKNNSLVVQKMVNIKKRADKRRDNEDKAIERNNRVFKTLSGAEIEKQIKYFVRVNGPIKGMSEYANWKEIENLRDGTKVIRDDLENIQLRDEDKLEDDDGILDFDIL